MKRKTVSEKTEGFSVWRNRDFRLLLSGQVVSYVGDQVQNLALPLLVLAITGSATQAGVMLGLHTIAFLLFGFVAGALVDRWNRKTTMIWCEIGRGLLTASIVVALWGNWLTVTQLYTVAVLTGVLTTIFQTADTAALPNVVQTAQLSPALGYMQASFNTVRIFGAALAGFVYTLGRSVPFVMNIVSFFVSAISLRFMRAEFQEKRTKTSTRLYAEIRESLAWVWKQPTIRFLTFIQAADNLRYGAGYLLIILLASRVGATPMETGLIFSGAAVGAMLGALVSARITRRYPLGRVAVVMLWVEALAFPLYAVAPNPLLLGTIAMVESVIAPIYVVAITTYRLSITPDNLQGRVTSAVTTLTTGALSLGTIFGGILLSAIMPQQLVLLSGLWLLLLAIATTTNRTVRRAPLASAATPVHDTDQGLMIHGNLAQ